MTVRARDIMTTRVVAVQPEMTVADAARLLAEHRISAAPVCRADGALVGMVSEGDLLRPFEPSRLQRRAWWLGVLAEGEELSREFLDYVRGDRREVRDLMTAPAVSVEPDAALSEIASILDRLHIKRVPVTENNRVLGIVSRADLVRALARSPTVLAETEPV